MMKKIKVLMRLFARLILLLLCIYLLYIQVYKHIALTLVIRPDFNYEWSDTVVEIYSDGSCCVFNIKRGYDYDLKKGSFFQKKIINNSRKAGGKIPKDGMKKIISMLDELQKVAHLYPELPSGRDSIYYNGIDYRTTLSLLPSLMGVKAYEEKGYELDAWTVKVDEFYKVLRSYDQYLFTDEPGM